MGEDYKSQFSQVTEQEWYHVFTYYRRIYHCQITILSEYVFGTLSNRLQIKIHMYGMVLP